MSYTLFKKLNGTIDTFYQHGCIGLNWIFYDNDKQDVSYLLKNGDKLKIYDKNEILIFNKTINFDYNIKLIENKFNNKKIQEVYGFIVNGIQKDVNPETWFKWFHNKYKASLVRKVEL